MAVPNKENASPLHKKGRSSFVRLNMAVVLENLGDLCAISARNVATRDQLIARLKHNCAYWKANDRDAKILVDEFLIIGRRQNLCHPVAGRSQTWTVGPPPLKIELHRIRRTTSDRENSNVVDNLDGKVSSRKNSPEKNPKSALWTDTRATYSGHSPLKLRASAVYASEQHEDSGQLSTTPTIPIRLTDGHYSPVPLLARREEELSLPPVEESASAISKCQRCGGRCEHSLVELYKKAKHFSYDIACFKPMFEQILIRRQFSERSATADRSKPRNICVECNCTTSRPPPSYRIRRNYSLDELLNMLAELNRRRILTKMDMKAKKEKSYVPTHDHHFHKKHHQQKYLLTPRAIIPVTRQAEIELMQSPAGMNHCPKKKEKSWSKKRRRTDEAENSLKTAKSNLESPTSVVKPCSKSIRTVSGQICHL